MQLKLTVLFLSFADSIGVFQSGVKIMVFIIQFKKIQVQATN